VYQTWTTRQCLERGKRSNCIRRFHVQNAVPKSLWGNSSAVLAVNASNTDVATAVLLLKHRPGFAPIVVKNWLIKHS
jgi:hypothetical protein